MTGWEALISTLGLSFTSGINLYATVLVVGLAHRYGLIDTLPSGLDVLSNPWVLGLAGVLYALEFFADKIPFVATIWDGFHTFIRPLGAAFIALGTAQQFGPLGQALAVLVGGSVALGTHSTKAGFRMLANTAPEPTTHSLISIAEDVGVVGLTALVFANPTAAAVVLAVLIALMIWLTPLIWRTLRFLMSCFWGMLSASLGMHPEPYAILPRWLREELDKEGAASEARAYRGYARTNAGGPRLSVGYLVLTPDRAWFAREGWFRNSLRPIGSANALVIEGGVICDAVVARDPSGREARVSIAKHWSGRLRRESGFSPSGMATA